MLVLGCEIVREMSGGIQEPLPHCSAIKERYPQDDLKTGDYGNL
jgi:hypothetical protein